MRANLSGHAMITPRSRPIVESGIGMSIDEDFVEQFEQLLCHIEQVIQEYPPDMRAALRDEARLAMRAALQERWETRQRLLEEGGRDR